MNTELIKLFAPSYVLEHFEYEKYQEESGVIRIYLIEKQDIKHIPKGLPRKIDAVLNGFMNPVEIQTFPTQAKEVFLYLIRRRWKEKGSNISYYNTYNFCQEGMKATKEFGAFLKEIGRG
jgi:hypothetical protein